MEKEYINPEGIASPAGYTHVVKGTDPGSLIFVSGQVALDSERNVVGRGDIERQLKQVFTNLRTALASAGATFNDVVKLNTYMVDIASGIDAYRKVRAEFLGDAKPPASTLVEIKRLASPDFLVEIEAVAALE
ncbi:MAG: RidA family protein [Candidatus Bathyarchaeota archaeon]|nr:RidA family protein [Candidatus Bathyarchaeota archaeon]